MISLATILHRLPFWHIPDPFEAFVFEVLASLSQQQVLQVFASACQELHTKTNGLCNQHRDSQTHKLKMN